MLAARPPRVCCVHSQKALVSQPEGDPRDQVQPREHPGPRLSSRWEVLPGTLASQGTWTGEMGF